MMKAALFLPIVFFLSGMQLPAQQEVTIACIAFYNLENLFDTLDSPDTDDFEFTPLGPNAYTSDVYLDKLAKLASVISGIGLAYTPDGPALLGVAEIENRHVLEDLVRQPAIASRGYRVIHRDSRDARGVDVALLYNPRYFVPDAEIYIPLVTKDSAHGGPDYSRDILIVTGDFLGEKIAVTVNHWPSRRGGEQTTAHLRNRAASINRSVLDSLALHAGIKKNILMGDLNDDPVNDSVRKYLNAGRKIARQKDDGMYNPMEDFYRKGLGTTAYQDAWSLFDQIIVSRELAAAKTGLRFYKAGVYNPAFLTQRTGAFRGYPFRCYSAGSYTGGYSDHFPVYILLVKERP